MLKKILLILCALFLVTGCNIELKKSANNKLFDRKGFDGGKRKPLYNAKYIDRAKQNIVENNYDDDEPNADEPDEYVDPYTKNRIMYSNMIKREKANKRKKNVDYPDIGHAKDLAKKSNDDNSNTDLRQELAEIKTMLSSAKKDLAKYKCPLQDNQQGMNGDNVTPVPKKPKSVAKKPVAVKQPAPKPLEQKPIEQDTSADDDSDDVTDDDAKVASPIHDDEITDELPAPKAAPAAHAPAPPVPVVVPVVVPTPTPPAPLPAPVVQVPVITPPAVSAPAKPAARPANHNMINLAPNATGQ